MSVNTPDGETEKNILPALVGQWVLMSPPEASVKVNTFENNQLK